jgi:N-glycosylase/DNA lyase
MSLDQPSAVPVDTHVYQIAMRDYKFRFKGKKVASMTKDVYNAVGDFFRTLWGDYAGWAHSVYLMAIWLTQVLFTADLRRFKDYEGAEMTKVEITTPVKRRAEEGLLTPPDTIKSELIVEESEVVCDEGIRHTHTHFSRRSKRRRIALDKEDPFA